MTKTPQQIKFSDLNGWTQWFILMGFFLALFSLVLWIIFGNNISSIKDLPHKYCENRSIEKEVVFTCNNLYEFGFSDCKLYENLPLNISGLECDESVEIRYKTCFTPSYCTDDIFLYSNEKAKCTYYQLEEVCETR